jgi:hypothetical protein
VVPDRAISLTTLGAAVPEPMTSLRNSRRIRRPPSVAACLVTFPREAVKLVRKRGGPITEVAGDLGVTEGPLPSWVKQSAIDEGRAHGLSSEEKE